MTYKWTFNNTLENTVELITTNNHNNNNDTIEHTEINHFHGGGPNYPSKSLNHSRYYASGRQSVAVSVPPVASTYAYRLESFQSFGTISCNAQNVYGESGPCLYHIMAAEIPDPVRNCTLANATANSMYIACEPGRDGGIQQYFHIEIYNENTRTPLYNTSFKSSDFVLNRLPSDSLFRLKITAYNLQGSSAAFRMRGQTFPSPLLRTGKFAIIFFILQFLTFSMHIL